MRNDFPSTRQHQHQTCLRLLRGATLTWLTVCVMPTGRCAELPVTSHEAVRVATFNVALNRPTAGRLVADLQDGANRQAQRLARIIQTVRPDILLLNEIDFDAERQALTLFHDLYLARKFDEREPITYEYRYTAPVNTGVPSGLDLDGDQQSDGPGDAYGYGAFPGQYGMAVLSRYPIAEDEVRTFRKFLWKDMPSGLAPRVPPDNQAYYAPDVWAAFRLSSKSHWDVPVRIGNSTVHFLVCHPTPPVFDGPEDRNGCRNHDEIRFWADYVQGADVKSADVRGADVRGADRAYMVDDQGRPGPLEVGARFVIAGDMNADPHDGDSRQRAIRLLLDHPRVRSQPAPTSGGGTAAAERQGRANRQHRGDPAADTADFSDRTSGNLRVDYVLPSNNMSVVGQGVFWPAPGEDGADWVTASDHRLVWVDVQP